MALAVAALLPATTVSAAVGTGLPVPEARAYEGATPLPSVKPVLDYCAATPGGCEFTVDRAASQEYFTTVKSLGNAVINCTDRDITVDRRADLKVGSQDNLGGEISGTIALTGTINVSGSVTAGVKGEGSIEFKTPLLDKGPTTAIKGTGTATGEGTVIGAVGASAAFTGAFKANYLKTWTTEQTESTNYHMTVKGGDALVFGASVALPPFSGNATSATTQVQGWTIRYPNRLSGTESRHPDKAVALLLRNSSTK